MGMLRGLANLRTKKTYVLRRDQSTPSASGRKSSDFFFMTPSQNCNKLSDEIVIISKPGHHCKDRDMAEKITGIVCISCLLPCATF